ncbi:MAG: response regulator [Candidatus Koribacter versatilis]|uniref:Chemotaxis protein CheA n=1 Tax=Candidatus Korobacter versatilis TaxID=658062 RepID=A0A932A8I5_9BACT|nr:response regulator [Candidatus Koribacter versatilis]
MSTPGQEFAEIFFQEASEHLQFLREYSGILQDPYPVPEDLERLYISAHTLAGTSASYGYPLFSDVSGKLAHIFQYAMNATIGPDAAGPLVEFISEAIAVLESDLIMISATSAEAVEDIASFKQKYPFAFQAPAEAEEEPAYLEQSEGTVAEQAPLPEIADLPADGEVPEEILEFFVPEAEEHLQVVTECLLALEANPNPEDINRLFRAIHTIKGAAAQVGLLRISRVAHRAEDLVGRLREGQLKPSAEIVDLCLESVDILKKFLYRQWPDELTMQASTRALMYRIGRLAPEEGEEGIAAPMVAPAVAESPAAEAAHVPAQSGVAAESAVPEVAAPMHIEPVRREPHVEAKEDDETVLRKEPVAMPQSKSVRIGLERLDRMMNAVGELVINRTRMLGRLAELEKLADVLNFSKGRMSDKVSEFTEKHEFSQITSNAPKPKAEKGISFDSPYRGGYSSYTHSYDASLAEFSELEMDRYDDFNILSRSLSEISADITEVLTQLDGFVRRVDSDIDEFTKLAHRLQDEITQARMVPIGNLYTRISRTVRDAAKASNKQVELTLGGAETELDNNIIQQISDPLVHLVRNAVAHGLEKHDERYAAGKPDSGNIAVRAYHRGNHIYIEVEDDGRGIDYDRVRATAIEAGLVAQDDIERLTERDLLDLLFHPGFSTAPRKTELAGRGVGLDVVKANVAALNGEIEIDTEKGRGSRFTLKVPLTLIISQALFVRCGEATFALPLAFVEEIRRLRADEIEEVGGKLLTKVRDVVTEIVRLDTHLGLPEVEPVNGYYRLVLVNVAARQVGIVVEEVLRKDEIVIKSLGEYLRNMKMFPGATIAPDGSLILLVDVNRLIAGEAIERRPLMASATAARIFAPGAAAVAKGEIPAAAIDEVVEEKVVVLADDSISVRKFVGRMLEKAGYRVKLASDGLEALEIATQTRCDLVVTDLEMPRTNGYELIAHLRQSPETRHIPVMVVTSRAGAKHKDRALKEGAAAFLVKPVQEDQFLAEVAALIGGAGTQTKAAVGTT